MLPYTTLNNSVINCQSEPETIRFLQRVKAAAENPAVSHGEMLALVYGTENPILDREYLPGCASVTPAVLSDPNRRALYRILIDLIGRKRVQLGLLDLEKAHAEYTVSVPEAAARLGITQQAIRAAIEDWRLIALFRNGQWWLRPASIEAFKVSTRGRPRSADSRKVEATAGV